MKAATAPGPRFHGHRRAVSGNSLKIQTFNLSRTRGSDLIRSSHLCDGRLPKWPTGADCKSAGLRLLWFESRTYHHLSDENGSFSFKIHPSTGHRSNWNSLPIFNLSQRMARPPSTQNCQIKMRSGQSFILNEFAG